MYGIVELAMLRRERCRKVWKDCVGVREVEDGEGEREVEVVDGKWRLWAR